MSRGIGIVQEQVLRVVTNGTPVSMAAVRSKLFPKNPNSSYAYKATSAAVRTLIRRGWLEKLALRDDPNKKNGRRVLLKAVLGAY
jgi:hypothetical protein